MQNVSKLFALSFLLIAFLFPGQAQAGRIFQDIDQYDLADEVETLVDQGVLSRRTHFYPKNALSRAELSKIAVKFAGVSTNVSGTLPFSDLPPSSPFHSFILALHMNGMIKGYDDGTFKPERPVTRVEAAKIILNALDYPLKESCCTFYADVSSSDWFAPYTESLIKDGILPGITKTRFGVGDFISRGDALRLAINAKARLADLRGPLPGAQLAENLVDTGADVDVGFYPDTISSTSSNTSGVTLAEISIRNTGEVSKMKRFGFEVSINNKNNDGRVLNISNVKLYDQFNKLALGPVNAKLVNGVMRVEMDGDYELLKTFTEPRFKIVADLGEVARPGETIRIALNPRDKKDLHLVGKDSRKDITSIEPNKKIQSSAIAFSELDADVDIPVSSFSAERVPGSASPVLGVVLSAPTYQGIVITRMAFNIDQGDPKGILNAYLYDENGRLLDAQIVRSDSRRIVFDRMEPRVRLDRGKQTKLTLGVQFSGNANPGDTYIFSFTPNNENIAAEDFEGDQLNISGPAINSGPMAPIQFKIADTGGATSSTGPEVVDARQSLPGADLIDVLRIRLNADIEDINIEHVAISVGSDEQDDQIAGMELYIGDRRIGDFRSLNTNGSLPGFASWDFSGSSMPIIPRDGTLQLTVKAKFNITNNALAESGEATTFFLADLETEGRNDDIIPRLGSSKGTVTITSTGATAFTTNLDVNTTAGINVGDTLESTTTDPDKKDQEVMTVLAINSPTNISVRRGANQTQANIDDVSTGKTFTIVEGIISDPFVLYDSLLTIAPTGLIYGERGAPTSSQKVLMFNVDASDNPQDPRNQEVELKHITLTVVGNAAAIDFRLIDDKSSTVIQSGTGAHLGLGTSRVLFDLSKVASTKKEINEGSSRTYRVEANLQSFVADSSLSVFIDDLGNKNSTFGNNPSDLVWSDGSAGAIYWVDQPQNSVQPPPLTFNSIGGGVTLPTDSPTSAFVSNGGAGGTTPNIIDNFNGGNVSVEVTIPRQTTNLLGSGKDAPSPDQVEVILTDSALNSVRSTAPACDNSAASCVVTIGNLNGNALVSGSIRVEARAIHNTKSSSVFLGTQATKQ